jgi:hypothetical protein
MGTGVGCDVVPYESEVFGAAKGLNTSFATHVVSEGREVFRQ